MKMNRLAGVFFIVQFFLSLVAPAADFTIDQTHLQITAAADGALRLSVSAHDIQPIQSIFLSGYTVGASETIHDGNWVGEKTASGELLIDTAAKRWTLRDDHGKTLIATSPIPSTAADRIELNLMKSVDDASYYGSGDVSSSLQTTHAKAKSGNGHAVVPYFWSSVGYGVLAIGKNDNMPAAWKLDDGKNPIMHVPGEAADFYFFVGSLQQVTGAYALLTGRPPVPPLWAFGYLQSRWGWVDQAYIQDTLKQFRDRKLPVDAFIFDFEWFTPRPDYSLPPQGVPGCPDFRWNSKLFPNPQQNVADLHAVGVHFVGIRKPRIGDSDTLGDFRSRNWILPGPKDGIDARVINYQNPEVSSWYADQTIPLLKTGIDGWWDDEGELTYTTYSCWTQSQADALTKVNPDLGPWTLCRAFCPGLERYGAAAWTGDIKISWSSLQKTPPTLLNWRLAGMDYCGCDIGGFSGADESPELLTRWMQVGVFFTVMRAHSEVSLKPHFPWLWGPEAESAIRNALNLRYRLIPYYYSLAHSAYEHGDRLMRPMVMEFPDDPKVANLSDQWLIGRNLLAAPVLTPSNQRDIYLPAGDWFVFDSNTKIAGNQSINRSVALDEIPVYVRAGAILPLAPIIQHTNDLPGGPLDLQVYPGHDCTFTLIEDDGITTAYQHGQLRRTIFNWNDSTRTLTWTIDGPYAGRNVFTDMTIKLFDPAGSRTSNATLRSSGQASPPTIVQNLL